MLNPVPYAPKKISLKKDFTVSIGPADGRIPFRVRFFECVGTSERTLTHVHIGAHDDDEEQTEFWARVLGWYQRATRDSYRAGELPNHECGDVTRAEQLAVIALASPQKTDSFEHRKVSHGTVAEGVKIDGQRKRTRTTGRSKQPPKLDYAISSNIGELHAQVGPDSLRSVAAGCLADNNLRDPTVRERYAQFERGLLGECEHISKEHQNCPDAITQIMRTIHEILENIRKKADDETRINLRILHAACDTARMEMYHYVAGAIMDVPKVGAALDTVSLSYNRVAHARQTVPDDVDEAEDRLGGIVLAIQPMWTLFLNSGCFVDLLIDCASAPTSPKTPLRLDNALSQAIPVYSRLLDLQDELQEQRRTDGWDTPIGNQDDQGITHGNIVAASAPPPTQQLMLSELVAVLEKQCGSSRDVKMFFDRFRQHMTVQECATTYKCSIGNVTKRAEKGRLELCKCLLNLGITCESLEAFNGRRSLSKPPHLHC